MLIVVMMNACMLSVFTLSVFMLNACMLSVFMLSVVMLNIVAPLWELVSLNGTQLVYTISIPFQRCPL
jgi:hypothetical protein